MEMKIMIYVKRSQRVECASEANCIRAHTDDCTRCRRNRNHMLDYFDPVPCNPHYPYPWYTWYWSQYNNGWVYCNATTGVTMTTDQIGANSITIAALNSTYPDNYAQKS